MVLRGDHDRRGREAAAGRYSGRGHTTLPRSLRIPLGLAAVAVASGLALLLGWRPDDDGPSQAPTSTGPEPGVTVAPTQDLEDGQVLIVRGNGLPPELEILVAPCGRKALDEGRFGSCDLDAAASTETSEEGGFSVGYRVSRVIRVLGEDLDCAAEECVISVIRSGTTLVELAREPVTFRPVAASGPQLRVIPRSHLRHLSTMQITGSGFGDGTTARICASDVLLPDADGQLGSERWCDPATVEVIDTSSGTIDLSTTAPRVLAGPLGPVDCAAPGGRCELEVRDSAGSVATVRLWFDPAVPPPDPPALLAAPTSGLTDRHEVQLVFANLLGARYELALCVAGAPSPCRPIGPGAVNGPLRTSALNVTVPRLIAGESGSVDCGASAGVCVLRLAGPGPAGPGDHVVEVPLTFDRAQPLQLPLLALDPGDGDGAPALLVLPPAGTRPTVDLCPEAADPASGGCTAAGAGVRSDDGVWRWPLDSLAPGTGCSPGCEVVVTVDPAYPAVRLGYPGG